MALYCIAFSSRSVPAVAKNQGIIIIHYENKKKTCMQDNYV